jgi:hypothetical protein
MVNLRILVGAMLCAILALTTSIPQDGAATTVSAATTPEVGPGFALSGSLTSAVQAGKYPSIATAGTTVHMVANTNQAAQYWTKADTASSASGPITFGATGGDTDYTEAAIAAAPDGTLYAVWITQRSAINLRRKPVGGDWEATKAIYTTSAFLSYVDIAVSGSGQVFVVWNQEYLYRYRTSSDGGATWSSVGVVSSKKPYKAVAVAGGPNDSAVVAFGGGDGHAYAAVWNGADFDTTDLTPLKTSNDFFADAKPTIAPNGTIYVAFRNGSSAGGLYYTERQANGSWPVSKLAGGAIYGGIGVGVDSGNNVHIAWSSNASGSYQLYYAFKPSSGDWQGPLKATGVTNTIVSNVDLSPSIGARNYGHTIFETFDGDAAAIRYQQFSSEGSGISATPALDGGANATRNNSVTLSFSDVVGSPDSVRFHWDAAPTDADAWVALSSPLTVPAPSGITASACEPHVLYVQPRAGTTLGATAQAAITFDTGVQADVTVRNPHLAGLPAMTATAGAPDGAPNYTRERSFYLGINGQAECSHLDTFQIPGSESDPTARAIVSNSYSGLAVLPQGSAVGDRTIDVNLTDTLGNATTRSFTLTYDPANTDTTGVQTNTLGLPVLGSGGAITADSANSIMRSLHFQGINVTDNLYGRRENLPAGKQFWGVWLANATTDVGADSASLNWYSVRVPAPNSSFTVSWNLFTGLGFTSDLRNKPGDYYVYVRFLDGAGNPSEEALMARVTLAPGYSIPTVLMPMLNKS